MCDRLTQLQDAVDEFATQFVATINYINQRHDLALLGEGDQITPQKDGQHPDIAPDPPELFKANQVELAQDLITREQHIEWLISLLPGLDNSEKDQERNIKELEEELKVAEAQRQAALQERKEILARLDKVIRSIRRP